MKGVETLNALISFIAQIQYSGYGPFTYPVLLKIGILTWVCILSRFSNCPVHLRDDSFLCYKFLLHLFHLLLHLFHLPFQLKNYFLPMSSIPMRRPRILHTGQYLHGYSKRTPTWGTPVIHGIRSVKQRTCKERASILVK